MQDGFRVGVKEAHRATSRHRDLVRRIKMNAHANPEALAAKVAEVLPRRLKEWRTVAVEAFGVDLSDGEEIRKCNARSVAEWQMLAWLANHYQIYGACLRLVRRYATDPALDDADAARAVCEAFLEATERILYTVAFDLEDLRRALPDEEFPKVELTR